MRVAIVGSRDCKNIALEQILRHLPQSCSQIISGGARGVDDFARLAAEQIGIPFVCILPDYKSYGKQAPLVRNEKIVAQADLVLAFWDFHSRGTAHVIATCIEQRVPVQVLPLDSNE